MDQVDEDYCDDINVISQDPNDMIIIDDLFLKFESMSGAILNRSDKTKIMGLGGWRNKQIWPLSWVKVVEELKIFGFQITPLYARIISRCWDELLKGLTKCFISWRIRILPTLRMRALVIIIFATSKIWYKAQAIPLPHKYTLLIEKQIRIFLWQGKLEKLALDEVKHTPDMGGLAIPCVESKAEALFIKESCRMIQFSNMSSYKHIKYWIGQVIGNMFVDMKNGPHPVSIPPYYRHMANLLKEANKRELFDVDSLKSVTAKSIYEDFTTTFPTPKVVNKLPNEMPWNLIWKRLNSNVFESQVIEIMFLLIHDIIPNRQRLFRMGKTNHPFCLSEQ